MDIHIYLHINGPKEKSVEIDKLVGKTEGKDGKLDLSQSFKNGEGKLVLPRSGIRPFPPSGVMCLFFSFFTSVSDPDPHVFALVGSGSA